MPDNDKRTNRTLSLADIANLIGASADSEQEAVPEYDCAYCNDLGFVSADVPLGHVAHGRLFPCPECEKGREHKRLIMARKYKSQQLPSNFIKAQLADWLKLSSEQRKAKYLAYCFTVIFAENGGITSAHAAIKLLQEANQSLNLFKIFPDFLQAQLKQPDKIRNGVVLQGPVGIGKTWLVAAALNAMSKSHHVIFVKSGDFFEQVISTWGTDAKESDALDPYRHTEILFLDDLHIEATNKLSTYHREILTTLIRHRYDYRLPTMITTNSDKETFYEEWGKRVSDAVFDMCHWIPMAGEKLRDTEQNWSAI